MNEMTTLASIGDLPALPMGMRYPKKKGWLLGPVRKSKKLKFRRCEAVKLLVVPEVSEFFEAVDPAARAARLGKIKAYAKKKHAQFTRSMNTADAQASHARRGGRTMPASSANRYDLAVMSAIKRNRADGVVRKYDKPASPYTTKLQHMVDIIQLRGEKNKLKDRYRKVAQTLSARRKGSQFQTP